MDGDDPGRHRGGWPGWLDLWREGELEELPEAETRDAFDARVIAALAELTAAVGPPLLVVGHAGTLRALERHCGMPPGVRYNLGGVWLRLEDGSLRCTGRGPELNPPREARG